MYNSRLSYSRLGHERNETSSSTPLMKIVGIWGVALCSLVERYYYLLLLVTEKNFDLRICICTGLTNRVTCNFNNNTAGRLVVFLGMERAFYAAWHLGFFC